MVRTMAAVRLAIALGVGATTEGAAGQVTRITGDGRRVGVVDGDAVARFVDGAVAEGDRLAHWVNS
jgi:hypothetical protein